MDVIILTLVIIALAMVRTLIGLVVYGLVRDQ